MSELPADLIEIEAASTAGGVLVRLRSKGRGGADIELDVREAESLSALLAHVARAPESTPIDSRSYLRGTLRVRAPKVPL